MSGEEVWVGADPGGKKNFGIAVLWGSGEVETRCVSCAEEAVNYVKCMVGDAKPSGVGVDAPMWWSSGLSGLRRADEWLRDTYPHSREKVLAPNSLRGSVLAQGMMFVQRMRQSCTDVCVTETHPKVLLDALGMCEGEFYAGYGVLREAGASSEHERDAVISAVAVRQGFEGRWTHDLSVCRFQTEQNTSESWLAPVHYYWPPEK